MLIRRRRSTSRSAAGAHRRQHDARSGVTAAQYGNILANPAAQYNGLVGGNVNIDTGDPTFCGRVNRSGNGSLWLGDQGFIQDPILNSGSLQSTGVDAEVLSLR